MISPRCEGCLWVRESHPDTPWVGRARLRLWRRGMPCPLCNPRDEENPPRPPKGFRTDFDKNGWRH
jgi:hypothetical protein